MAEMKKNTQIDNTALVEAIAEMRKDFNPSTQNKVINLTLRTSFYVPANVSTESELVADAENKVKFEDKQKAQFLLITNPERGTFFPCFTDLEQLKSFKTDKPFQAFAMTFADLASLTERTPNVNGFIINPDREKLPYTKQILAGIKQTILEQRRKAAEAAKAQQAGEGAAPNITVSTNENPEG